ncbi:MAG: hypothetical protein ACE5Q6_10200 [Dehalococcoidia bacterium]
MKKLLSKQQGVGMIMVLAFISISVPVIGGGLALSGTLSEDSRVKTDILKRQYSALGVHQFVLELMDDPTLWEEWLDESGGECTIVLNGETITCNVSEVENPPSYSPNSDIEIKKESVVLGDLVSAGAGVTLEKEVVMQGDIRAGANVTIEKDAWFQGDIVSAGNVTLEKDTWIDGDVTAGGDVVLATGAVVTGIILEFQSSVPDIVPSALLSPSIFVAGSQNVTVEEEESLTLVPGSYGDLLVKKEATLNLSSGQYAFTDFKVKKESNINLDLDEGAITVDVNGKKLDIDKESSINITSGIGTQDDVLFRVQNKVTLDKEGQYLGTFLTLGGVAFQVTVTDSDGNTIGDFFFWYDEQE